MQKDIDAKLIKLLDQAEEEKNLGHYILALDKYKEARHFLAGEDLIELLFSLADLYSLMENFEDGKKTYLEILDLDANNSGAWYGLAYTSELAGEDLDQVLFYYERAIDLDPTYKEAYYYAGTIYGDLGQKDKAKAYLKKVIDLDPFDFIAYNDLGSLCEEENDLDQAKKYLEKSIDLNPNYYLSHFNLGVVYKKTGDHDQALEEYTKAKDLSDDIYIFLNMSAIYIEDQRYNQAIEILTEGINRNPHHILYYNRACSYRKLGNISQALKDYKEAKNLDPVVEKWAENDIDLMDIIKE